jgi:uncharacterized protein YndB with AHSA1/START domain
MTRAIAITRVFDAPRERVWRAWTEPDELVAWWGKRGWTAQRESLTMDLRPGGVFRVVSVSDQDGREQVTEGVYVEIEEPERLSFGEATVLLTDLGDGRTRMDFRTRLDAPDDVCDAAAGGLASAFERLAERLQPKEPR